VSGVFVSHASPDRVFVDEFVERVLRLGCELSTRQLFYSSGADTGIPSGSDLGSYLRSRLEDVGLVVAIITPTFQTRPYCLAELGAAWVRTGQLFPLLAPDMSQDDLDGVLKGAIVRSIDDPAALDELHDAVLKVTGVRVAAATWSNNKARWLERVSELATSIPSVSVGSVVQLEALKQESADKDAALAASESVLRKLRDKFEELARAKTIDEVNQATLPEDRIERLKMLLEAVWTETDKLELPVTDVLWRQRRGVQSVWPSEDDDRYFARTMELVDDGFLLSRDGVLTVNRRFPVIRRMVDALDRLDEFLATAGEDFEEWFMQIFDLPPDLWAKRVWDTLLHSKHPIRQVLQDSGQQAL
jgi:hypothetical protein